mgnify:CR=1 FL=1
MFVSEDGTTENIETRFVRYRYGAVLVARELADALRTLIILIKNQFDG